MRARLIAAFVSLVTLMLLVQDGPLASYLTGVEHERILTMLERDAWKLASQNDTAIAYNYPEALQANLTAYAARTNSHLYALNSVGVVMASSKSGEVGQDFSNEPEVAQALLGVATSGDRASDLEHGDVAYVCIPVESRGTLVGVLRISYPRAEIDSVVNQRISVILLVGLLTLALTVFAAHVVATTFTRRISRLQAATAELAAGDLSVRVAREGEGGAPELIALERAFDSMVERLSAVLESQRTFASDASHQLRTPLTALRLQLENAAKGVADPELTASRIEAASGEVQRLQALVDGLVSLARIEGRIGPRTAIDVSAVVLDHVELWQPLAHERGITIAAEVEPELQVLAWPGYVDQVIDAYLDNALDFAPVGSVVAVRAFEKSNRLELHVVDEGPGLTEEEAQSAFRRFWRGRTDGSGTGLGLAIVARIADGLGAKYGIDSTPGSGADAYFKLDLADG